jgi:hypothetical protein
LTPDELISAESAHLEHSRRRALVKASESSLSTLSGGGKGRWKMTPLSEGYVTLDSCGPDDLGDDTLHTPFKVSRQPIFVSTSLPSSKEEKFVDVVFFDFIQPDIISALNWLDQDNKDGKKWGVEDVELYLEDLTANTLLETWAKRAWN